MISRSERSAKINDSSCSLRVGASSDDPEVQRIHDALARTGGSRERAAKLLGLSRVTLCRRMRELGIDLDS